MGFDSSSAVALVEEVEDCARDEGEGYYLLSEGSSLAAKLAMSCR
jgi:hypothetical protein